MALPPKDNAEIGAIHAGRGKWSQAGVPHKGWTCVGFEDLGDRDAICEMCEGTAIRYAHYMEHPRYPTSLICGCVCAGKMAEDLVGAERREQSARNAHGRRSRWLTRKWRQSRNGNDFIKAAGYHIVVFSSGQQWLFRIENTGTKDKITATKPLPTQDAAKLRAFDAMVWMKDRGR